MDDNAQTEVQQDDQQQAEQASQQPEYTPEQVAEIFAENERLKAHHSKLLDETKTAKQKAAELDEQKRIAEEQRMKENEQFKELYEKTNADLEAERQQRQEFEKSVQQREISSESFKAAASIAVDDGSAELLAEKIASYAKHKDGAVVYEIGGVEVTKDKVISTVSEKYPRLIKGSGATGGSATGSNGSSAANGKAQQAKANNDVTGFLQAHFSN